MTKIEVFNSVVNTVGISHLESVSEVGQLAGLNLNINGITDTGMLHEFRDAMKYESIDTKKHNVV